MTIPQALDLALAHHQAGRLAEAEALYRQILAVQPNHADALHFLGMIAQQVGRHDLAVDLIREAIVLDPNNAAAHSNLGEACRHLGRLDEAIAAYHRALELMPGLPESHYNLGIALREQGRLDDAVAAFRRAIELRSNFAEAHNNLGATLREQGRHGEALAANRRALELKPEFPEAHNNLGIALRDQGELDGAVAACRRALELKPDYLEAWNSLGNALKDQGQLDEAMAAYRRALELKPDSPEAHNNLGIVLRDCGHLQEAMAAHRRAIELRSNFPEAHNNLGIALKDRGQLDEAIAAFHDALALRPDLPEAYNHLGCALRDRGQFDEGIAAYRRALALKPDFREAHDNLIFALHFHPGSDARAMAAEHERWNRQFSEPLKALILPEASDRAAHDDGRHGRPHTNDRATNRPLRIGYVSPDLRDHPVGRYLLPLFEQHDRERFEIHAYSGAARPDWITERLRAHVAVWRNTVGLSDSGLAEMIREDGVDVLVDLSLHTAENRLLVFARRPAPVQVTWLGYPGSPGLPSIDYRLTDAHMDPPESRNRGTAWSAEEPVRLPDCWCCYQPVDESPEINALPALSSQGVTFGALNNFAKVHEGVLALWVKALHAVEGSRLLMLCPEGRARERVRAFFGERGIGPERVEWAGFLPRWEYLRLYQQIDLGLDPFPCNGMTTTCDALWMGVPVLTLPGSTPVSRAGLSLLSSVGLGEFAASSEEDYVRIAQEISSGLPRLAGLRAGLRERMLASPIMDAPRFARNIEAAYGSMWERWRGENKG